MMPFLLAEYANREKLLPLYVVCVGSHEQKMLRRPEGFAAHQLFLCRGGKGVFRIEASPVRELTLTPGTALVLPAGVPHTYAPSEVGEAWDLGFIAFHGQAAPAVLAQMDELGLLLSVVPIPNLGALWDELSAIWQLLGMNGGHAYWEASRRLYGMAVTFVEGQFPAGHSGGSARTVTEPNSALDAAIKLLHDHYDEKLLMTNVARAVGYSVQHFHRLFVASFGITPQKYMLDLRMRRAVQLFGDDPDITVDKVARQLGMEPSYFIRMFKRTYGKTPKRHAKRLKLERSAPASD